MKNALISISCLFFAHSLVAQNNYVATSPSSATPGSNNTIVGLNAGVSITDAQRNVLIGNESAFNNKSARDNVYIGYSAAAKDVSSGVGESVYIGNEVGFNLNKGEQSVLIGFRAGKSLNSISESIVIGYNAAGSLKGGFSNTMIGWNAGTTYTGIQNMVCIGQSSGSGRVVPNPKTGDNSTYIGFEAAGADGLTNATAIGAKAFVSQSGSLILGSKEILVGIGNSAPRNRLEITTSTPNQSGLRFTNLTANSPAGANIGKVLSVSKEGDVILTSGTDLTSFVARLETMEKANADQMKQITALQKANTDLTKRVAILEGQRSGKSDKYRSVR